MLNAQEHAAGPGELLCYSELLETSQLFLCNLTRAPAAQMLLLVAARGGIAEIDGVACGRSEGGSADGKQHDLVMRSDAARDSVWGA